MLEVGDGGEQVQIGQNRRRRKNRTPKRPIQSPSEASARRASDTTEASDSVGSRRKLWTSCVFAAYAGLGGDR
jgi:hypothetical protein